MSMIGKIIGGAIGFAMGGPLGAVAGAVFGHAYDTSRDLDEETTQRPSLSSGEKSQLTFFVAAFSMLAKLARSDGQITRQEVDAVERFISQDLQLSPESRKVAMDVFLTAMRSSDSFENFAQQFYGEFAHRPEMLELMIDILFRVSISDAPMTEKEESLIRAASGIFHFSPAQYDRIKRQYVSQTDHYYAVLKSQANDSMDQIKSQYRKLVSEYHPDKIAAKGLPEDFIQFANERFREIQNAYEEIKRERGVQ